MSTQDSISRFLAATKRATDLNQPFAAQVSLTLGDAVAIANALLSAQEIQTPAAVSQPSTQVDMLHQLASEVESVISRYENSPGKAT
jgi:hypothetical protein